MWDKRKAKVQAMVDESKLVFLPSLRVVMSKSAVIPYQLMSTLNTPQPEVVLLLSSSPVVWVQLMKTLTARPTWADDSSTSWLKDFLTEEPSVKNTRLLLRAHPTDQSSGVVFTQLLVLSDKDSCSCPRSFVKEEAGNLTIVKWLNDYL